MALKSISLSIPVVDRTDISRVGNFFRKLYRLPFEFFSLLKRKFLLRSSELRLLFVDRVGRLAKRERTFSEEGIERADNQFNSGKTLKSILLVLIGVVVLFGLIKVLGRYQSSGSSEKEIEVGSARASMDVNKEFTFPLKDDKGEKVSDLKYMIEKAELRDEIVVKGQRAKAVKGRTFLILNLKITNSYNQRIEIKSRDYVRLSVNGNKEEWLAPDVHNDPVEVQAISTKYTRIGFPINTADEDLVLRVGEINGEKEEIPLNL